MDVTAVMTILFWLSVGCLAYIYAGYPLLIALLGRVCGRRVDKGPVARPVSVVLVVYNEASRIVSKLDNILSLTGAGQLVDVLVGSDGSTDDTNSLVSRHADPRVRLHAFAERRGKPAVLNDLLARCRGEIVLLVDARQELDAACLTELLANFADPTVGVVSGELMFRRRDAASAAAEGIGVYWTYEKFLRKSESRFRGVPGATGACYAIRRDLFRPIPTTTILDDVAIPLEITAQGFRCLFEPRAIAWDDPSATAGQESIRKRRTIAGAAQLVRLFPQWLLPWRQPLWFEFISHKLLRLTSPMWLTVAWLTNLWLATIPLYTALLILQLCGYLAAAWGWQRQRMGRRSRLGGPCLMFVLLNWTTAQALWDAWRSNYRVTWTRASP
jgi:cellulose synthase/poly-beta-1,6-N-acetylglucosamine synthase-like glycosyltransferase